jgi:hypothetical protein
LLFFVLDLNGLLKKLARLRAESLNLDAGDPHETCTTTDEQINRTREEHIRDLRRLIGEDPSGYPSIPPPDFNTDSLNAKYPFHLFALDEIIRALLFLLDTSLSDLTAASRDIRSHRFNGRRHGGTAHAPQFTYCRLPRTLGQGWRHTTLGPQRRKEQGLGGI